MSLGIYGDGGTMVGSGIYSEDYSGVFYCSECDSEYDLDGSTDDSGNTAYAECPSCKAVLDKDVAEEIRARDEDYAYERMRESQLD